MRKLLLTIGFILGLSASLFAGDSIYFPRSTAGMSLYTVGTSTTVTATYTVTDTSITFTTTGGAAGVQNGSTYYLLTGDVCGNTLDSFITFINALSTSTPGAYGGIVATLDDNVYGGNLLTGLTAKTETTCLGIANIASLAMTTIQGFSYSITATDVCIYLTKLIANATYASGTLTINIYDGTTTGNQIWRETGAATTVDKVCNFPDDGIKSSRKAAMRIDVVGTAALTSGFMDIVWEEKR